MPHIDEGTVHAYLDGALPLPGLMSAAQVEEHVQSCSACRDMVVEERAVRERASSVLASADLAVAQPPFDEVQARAARNRATHVVRLRRLRMLAAAAVVIAVAGVGLVMRRDVERSVASLGEVAIDSVAVQTRGNAEQQASRGADADASDMAASSERLLRTVPVPEPSEDAPVPQPAAAEPAVALADRADRLEAAEGAGVSAGPGGRVELEGRMREAPAAVARRSRAQPAAENVAAPTEIDAVWADLRDAVVAPVGPESKVATGNVAVRQMDESVMGWRAAAADQAEAYFGRPVPVVPDVAVTTYELGTVASRPAVRVTQRLEDGVLFSLVTWQLADVGALGAAIGARAATEFASDVRVTVVYGSDIAIMVSGALPLARLEALAAAALALQR